MLNSRGYCTTYHPGNRFTTTPHHYAFHSQDSHHSHDNNSPYNRASAPLHLYTPFHYLIVTDVPNKNIHFWTLCKQAR